LKKVFFPEIQGARRLVTCVKEIPIGMFILCLIIYFVRDWQHLHYWTAAACAVGLPAYFWLIFYTIYSVNYNIMEGPESDY
jgi:hypothetical protein